MTLIGEGEVTYTQSSTDFYMDLGATCVDPEDGDLNALIEISGDVVILSTPGTYTITYTCTDSKAFQPEQRAP